MDMSILAIIISGFALLISIVEIILHRRDQAFTKKSLDDKSPNLVPYLITSATYLLPKFQLFAIFFSISNRSDSDNSISKLDFQINLTQKNMQTERYQFPNDSSLKELLNLGNSVEISVPTAIDAHKTISGWGLFRVPNQIFQDKRIENYCLRIIDAHDIEASIPMEIILEKEMDEKPLA